MLQQLIRQEALDAYADRWLGDPAERRGFSPLIHVCLASLCTGLVAAFVAIGSYAGHATIERTVETRPGSRHSYAARAPVTLRQAAALQIDQPITLQLDDTARTQVTGRITAFVPLARGESPEICQVEIEIPRVSGALGRPATTLHFRALIPLARRQVWCLLASRSSVPGRMGGLP